MKSAKEAIKPTSISLPKALKKEAIEMAKSEHLTLSAYVRKLIREAIR